MSTVKKHLFSKLTIIEIILSTLPYIVYALVFNRLPAKLAVHLNDLNTPDLYASKVSVGALLICSLGFIGLFIGRVLKKFVIAISFGTEKTYKVTELIMDVTELLLTLLFASLALVLICDSCRR